MDNISKGLILGMIIILLTNFVSAETIGINLSHLYQFEDNLQDIGNGTNIFLTPSGALSYVAGKDIKAVNIGENYMTNYSLDTTNVATIGFWFKPITSDDDDYYAGIGSATANDDIVTYSQNDHFTVLFKINSATQCSQEILACGLSDGVWTHIMITNDGTDFKVYCDGSLEYTCNNGASFPSDFTRIIINADKTLTHKGNTIYDQVFLSNDVANAGNASRLWNGGTGINLTTSEEAPPTPELGEIIVTQIAPQDAATTNKNVIDLVYFVNSTNSTIDNCSLFINGIVNRTSNPINWSSDVTMEVNGYNFSTDTFTAGDREVAFISTPPTSSRAITNSGSPVADGWSNLLNEPNCNEATYHKNNVELDDTKYLCINLTTKSSQYIVMEILSSATSNFKWAVYDEYESDVTNNSNNNFSEALPEGNYNWSVSCYDVEGNSGNTTNRSLTVDRFNIANITYNASGYFQYDGVNYTRNLSYSINLTCNNDSTPLNLYIDDVINQTINVTCIDEEYQIINNVFTPRAEGIFNIRFEMAGEFSENKTFTADLNPPTITLSFAGLDAGFGVGFQNTTLNGTCSDTIMPYVTFNFTINVQNLFFGNITSNTTLSNSSSAISDGNNTLYGICGDPFSNTTAIVSSTIYAKNISLIDELDNNYFNLDNCTGARVYFDDNSTFYDFKDNSRNNITFVSLGQEKLRFELTYENDIKIIRYIDISLTDGDLRVCANKEGITHYEQLIVSALERPVILKNVFSNCIVAADYTRFAYQDALVLKAYTINSMYYLYILNVEEQILLASLDGSLSTYINIDTLEFNNRGYNLDIFGDSLTFEKTDTTEIMIRYQNTQDDNVDISVYIERLDTNEIVLNDPTIYDPNNFTLFFDYSTLNNITNQTLFRIELEKTKDDGEIETSKRYFNTQANTGIIPTGVGFFAAFALMVFGLTFAISRVTFSWFGIFVVIGSIAILTVTIGTWVITFMMAIDAIILVFIIILMVKQNYPTVS